MVYKLQIGVVLVIMTMFSCNDENEIIEPIIITHEPGLVEASHTYYSISAELTSLGNKEIISRGFAYSNAIKPEVDNSEVLISASNSKNKFYSDFKIKLESNATYYVRAYVETDDGIYYGNEVNFNSLKGQWKQVASFPGPHRKHSITFTVNNKAYLVGGESLETEKFNDVWEFDPLTNEWLQKSNFPKTYVTSEGGDVFVINEVAYFISSASLLEYNPNSDIWMNKGDGIGQSHLTAFSVNGKGYAGNGFFNGGFYVYDPGTNTWSTKRGFPGEAMYQNYGVANGTSGFVGYGGEWPYDNFVDEFYEYSPSEDVWTKRNSFLRYGRLRKGMICFSIDEKIYMGMGQNINEADFADLFEYNPDLNWWEEVNSLEGTERSDAISFSVNGKGYVGLGFLYYNEGRIDKLLDFWEYIPD